jgi:hypothetical protein
VKRHPAQRELRRAQPGIFIMATAGSQRGPNVISHVRILTVSHPRQEDNEHR